MTLLSLIDSVSFPAGKLSLISNAVFQNAKKHRYMLKTTYKKGYIK